MSQNGGICWVFLLLMSLGPKRTFCALYPHKRWPISYTSGWVASKASYPGKRVKKALFKGACEKTKNTRERKGDILHLSLKLVFKEEKKIKIGMEWRSNPHNSKEQLVCPFYYLVWRSFVFPFWGILLPSFFLVVNHHGD